MAKKLCYKDKSTIAKIETGDYAVFIPNNAAIIRRVYQNHDTITLKPINTNYLPTTYSLDEVIVYGRVVEIRRPKLDSYS